MISDIYTVLNFPNGLCRSAILSTMYEHSSCPTFSPILDNIMLLFKNLTILMGVSGFNCMPLMTDDVEHLSGVYWSFIYLLCEVSVQVFDPFFIWLFDFLSFSCY